MCVCVCVCVCVCAHVCSVSVCVLVTRSLRDKEHIVHVLCVCCQTLHLSMQTPKSRGGGGGPHKINIKGSGSNNTKMSLIVDRCHAATSKGNMRRLWYFWSSFPGAGPLSDTLLPTTRPSRLSVCQCTMELSLFGIFSVSATLEESLRSTPCTSQVYGGSE